jgi:hypothetical protein
MHRHKTEINDMIKKALSGGLDNFNSSFVVEIESGSEGMEKRSGFAVHHIIQDYPENEKLRAWTKAEAMIPWVALAAKLPVSFMTGASTDAILTFR